MQEEIRSGWMVSGSNRYRPIGALPECSPAWTFHSEVFGYGVAIPYDGQEEIVEEFAAVQLRSLAISEGSIKKALILCGPSQGEAFASLCSEFVRLGEGGVHRERIVSNPVSWWEEWKSILGNRNVDKRVYDVLGELLSLVYLSENQIEWIWHGPGKGTKDIVCPDANSAYEVKSTVTRNSKSVQMHGLYQVEETPVNQHLIHCVFEYSENGVSIDDAVSRLVELGYSSVLLERSLESMGYQFGSSARKRRFVLLDMLIYAIDEDFPRVTTSSFVGGALPSGVTSINYDISLAGLKPISVSLKWLNEEGQQSAATEYGAVSL